MEGRGRYSSAKRVLAIAPAVPAVLIAVLVAVTLVPHGEWLTVEQGGEPEAVVDGAFLDVTVPLAVTSHMPYGIGGLSLEAALTDELHGSRQTLFSSGPVDIPARGTAVMEFSSRIFAPTLYLMLGDLMAEDGSALRLDLTAGCGYLLGLARFTLDAEAEVRLASEGSNVEVQVLEDTDLVYMIAVTGLVPSLVPGDQVLTATGGGHEMTVTLASNDGTVTVAFGSDEGLQSALEGLAASDDLRVTDSDGEDVLSWEYAMRMLEALNLARGDP